MSHTNEIIWCDGCGTEIYWVPYVIENQDFCCYQCAYGLTCQCGDNFDWDEEHRDVSRPSIPYWGD